MKIGIINGPNLNLTGIREPLHYGTTSFIELEDKIKTMYPEILLNIFQSNIEGELIDKLHEWGFEYDGIILNAAAYTHTSIAIADAIRSITSPVIEVHLSNIFSRESFRHQSHIAPVATGSISGLGMSGYLLAVNYFVSLQHKP